MLNQFEANGKLDTQKCSYETEDLKHEIAKSGKKKKVSWSFVMLTLNGWIIRRVSCRNRDKLSEHITFNWHLETKND